MGAQRSNEGKAPAGGTADKDANTQVLNSQSDLGQDGGDEGNVAEPEDDETWFAQLDPAIRSRVEKWHGSKVTGLKSALDSERGNSKKLEKDLRAAAQKAEKGSELETQLNQAANDLEAERGRASFYEEAADEDVLPGYAKILYTAAQDDQFRTSKGNVDWKALRSQYGNLFRQKTTPKGNAGAGVDNSGGVPGRQVDMNSMFRTQVRQKNNK